MIWLRRHDRDVRTFAMILSGLRQPDPWRAALFAAALPTAVVFHPDGWPWAT